MGADASDTPALESVQLHGLSVPIDRRLMSAPIIESLTTGRYEIGEARVLPRLIRPGERVVEIGAGIGVLTALIARTGKAERVAAIEASPLLQDYISQLFRLNGVEVELRQALVTPERSEPTATFYLHQDLWASSPARIKRRHQIGTLQVPVLSLAEVAETWRPSLLVVDIEPFAAWTFAEAAPHTLAGADFRPFERVLLELKPKKFPPEALARVMAHFAAQGFVQDAELSHAPLVLFTRS